MQKRNILNSPRLLEFKKKKKKIFFKKIFFLITGSLAVLIALGYFSNLKTMNITDISVLGNRAISTQTINNSVQEVIEKKFLFLFSRKNIFLYPKNRIIKKLTTEFKRFKKVDIAITENNVLQISVEERLAEYIWCGLEPTVNQVPEEQKCFFLDTDGYFFDSAPYFSDDVYFKFYGLPEGTKLIDADPLGMYFSKIHFSNYIDLKNKIIGIGLKPTALHVKNEKEAQILLSKASATSPAPIIIFNIESNFERIKENLDLAINTEPLKSKLKNNYSSLEYIDLGYENKVFYKFKDE